MRISLYFIFITFLATGCGGRDSSAIDNTYSASRHMGRGVRALGGKHGDSRQVSRADEFCPRTFDEPEFIPLQDQDGRDVIAMEAIPQPIHSPGEDGSPVPSVDKFKDPQNDAQLKFIFKNMHFGYDNDRIQGQENLRTIRMVSQYMKEHSKAVVFIEGHCDERGPQAYNLALGTRRANSVRKILVAEGINANRLYTASYGKERPIAMGHNEDAWAQNRRAAFKVFER